MQIFEKEMNAGLADVLKANTVSIASEIFVDPVIQTAKAAALGSRSCIIYPTETDDVTYVNSIMVTANWNNNDDIFTKDELYAKRETPRYKPANMDHNGSQFVKKNEICGVITDAYSVDNDYAIAEEDACRHILVSTMIWKKYFPDYADTIKKGVADGTKFVSMECVFKDFGYGLRKDKNSPVTFIERNSDTSSMTKSLRMYGGKGKISIDGEEYEIGRWIRNYVFSGIGFVDRPGNSESIIFTDSKILNASALQMAPANDLNLLTFTDSGVLFSRGNIPLWLE